MCVVEYDNERCFIEGKRKLVTSFEGEKLWRTIINENGTDETFIELEDKEDSKAWERMYKKAEELNKSLNKNKDLCSSFITLKT